MTTYLERYQRYIEYSSSGRRYIWEIWAELLSLGASIRQEPLYTDARAVAHAIMLRARDNVATLIARLKQLDYYFDFPERVWIPPTPDTARYLDDLENQIGPLPLVVRMWFEVVGSVNFIGNHPKLSSSDDTTDSREGLSGTYGDPLVIDTGLVVEDEGSWSLYEALNLPTTAPEMYELPFSPDAVHKAGESGGGPLHFLVPNPAFDSPICGDERWDGMLFLPYLQTNFEWGGFPGLRGGWYRGDTWNPAYSEAELAFLTKDLLPLL